MLGKRCGAAPFIALAVAKFSVERLEGCTDAIHEDCRIICREACGAGRGSARVLGRGRVRLVRQEPVAVTATPIAVGTEQT